MSNQIGVIGLAVMGANLARNLASKGYTVAAYNRTYQKTENLLEIFEKDKQKRDQGEITGYKEIKEFVESLQRPRKILFLVKSGQPIDDFIEKLYPLLDEGDIIMDTGNSFWKDTQRRIEYLDRKEKKIYYLGSGISGGEEGALRGPSIMPGGQKQAVDQMLPYLQKIAAEDFSGGKCVTNVGKGASGHFVKMVHNGIEYAIMQTIAEFYDLFRFYSLSNQEMQQIFSDLNSGPLQSFLLEITIKILTVKDSIDPEKYLVDQIRDEAKAKGTGAWTVQSALELGIPVPAISNAVMARSISSRNQKFGVNREVFNNLQAYPKTEFHKNISTPNLQSTLETIYTVCYLQGLDLIIEANLEYNWDINVKEVLRIWQGGCIIRSKMLNSLSKYYEGGKRVDLLEIMEDETKKKGWTSLMQLSTGVPTPVINSVWDYLLSLSNTNLPTNLIQAQRDYFGAHGYKRLNQEETTSGGWYTRST